ncbi:MAG: hypothetical protein DYG92_08775 [Leptolyngbya sp. PLA1]|nr:hypothetical protein [Leptolyngbya sp. PLA1]
MTQIRRGVLALVLTVVAGTAWAAGSGGACVCGREHSDRRLFRADDATDRRHYPPPRVADMKHARVELSIADMNVPELHGTCSLTMAPISEPMSTLRLDAKSMRIESVSCEGFEVSSEHDGRAMTVTFTPPVPAGQDVTLVTRYEVSDPMYGLIWTPESPEWPGRAAQIHTQGEPETNSYWFPCHDSPNEKLTTEVLVTLPAGFLVSSNGRLVSHETSVRTVEGAGGSMQMKPAETWHWAQDKPHAAYLVSVVIGAFDVVDVGTPTLSMPVYVPPGRGGDVPATFGRTKDMVEFFGKVLDEPYPWDRYAQLSVWNFGWGGMENTSCTTLYDTVVNTPDAVVDHDQHGLIAHELAHQWFGDLVTCNSWDHIWLNEGLTTFMNTLWLENRDGKDEYLAAFRGTYDGLIASDKPDAPASQPMVSNIYDHPWENFRRPANPYGKGSSIAHMLRVRLGDAVFFKGLATYLDRRRYQTAETSDLRRAFEEVSGESLEQFFAQWCDRTGVPDVKVTADWDQASGQLRVKATQLQNIDPDNPAFEFDLPMVVRCVGTDVALSLPVTQREVEASFALPAAPEWIALDPELGVLGKLSIDQSEAANLALAEDGPTAAAKTQGLRGLASAGAEATTVALSEMARDAGQSVSLRVEAVKALGRRGAMTDLRSMLSASLDRWEVREAVVNEVAGIPSRAEYAGNEEIASNVAEQLAEAAKADKSLKVRCAAVRGLGRLKAAPYRRLIESKLAEGSQSEGMRNAAVDALVSFDDAAALQSVMTLTRRGLDSRLRANATAATATLGKHGTDAALTRLVELLGDREGRVRRAAGDGLVTLKDPRGLEAIEKAIAASRAREWTDELQGWASQLRK